MSKQDRDSAYVLAQDITDVLLTLGAFAVWLVLWAVVSGMAAACAWLVVHLGV